VDEKSNFLLVIIPRAWIVKKALKTLDNNNGI
jgi:hypothetical protein